MIILHRLILITVSVVSANKIIASNHSKSESNASPDLANLLRHYNKLLRPENGGQPVMVAVSLSTLDIASKPGPVPAISVSTVINFRWTDTRLAFHKSSKRSMLLNRVSQKKIWKPDVKILTQLNERNSDLHTSVILNGVGEVVASTRVRVVVSCRTKLGVFPHDRPMCDMKLGSTLYTTNDVVLIVGNVKPFTVEDEMEQFKVINLTLSRDVLQQATGNYSVINISLLLRRNLEHCIMTVYAPSMVMVLVAYLAFWFPRSGAPQRITMGLITLLAMTVLLALVNGTTSKVAVFNVLDCYMMTCLGFIFVSLLETVFVSQLHRQKTKRKSTHRESAYTPMIYRKDRWWDGICSFTKLPARADFIFRIAYPVLFATFVALYFTVFVPSFQQ